MIRMLSNALFLTLLLLLPSSSSTQQVPLTNTDFRLEAQFEGPFLVPEQEIGIVPLPLNSRGIKIHPTLLYRPRSLELLHRNRLRSLQHAESDAEQVTWDPIEVDGPDVNDLHTLAQLARMSGNAYALPGQKNWYEVDQAWNRSFPFGWEDSDGFRGHVFQSSDNSTIVLSIKGTTLQGPTSKLDKFNDNLLFSCCCARVDISWIFRTVCDCYSSSNKCDSQCLTDALIQDSLFYSIGVKLVDDLLKIYPSSNIWLVGHSLGGSLASLLGATYGLPAIAFEAPGERLAASRLHLPLPPPISPPPLPLPPTVPQSSQTPNSQSWGLKWHFPYPKFKFPFPGHTSQPSIPIPSQPPPPPPPRLPSHHIATTHVYHSADPIPQGTCTGIGSPCAQAGYALETKCHLGQSIVFDSVRKLKWGVDVRKHVIKQVVTKVLEAQDVCWGDEDDDDNRDDDNGDNDNDNDDDDDDIIMYKPELRKDRNREKGKEKPRECKRNVPHPVIDEDCSDCHKWRFGNFKTDR